MCECKGFNGPLKHIIGDFGQLILILIAKIKYTEQNIACLQNITHYALICYVMFR